MTPPLHGVPLGTPNSRLLRIKVVQARELSKDIFGSNDPFVQLALCKKNESNIIELVKTPTIKKSTNPAFNVDFIFNVVPKEHKLLIDLFYENKITRNDLVGRVSIPLDNSRIIISNENEPNARNKIDFPLEKRTIFNKVKGKLNLIVHFVSSVESLNNIMDLTPAPPTNSRNRKSISAAASASNATSSIAAASTPTAPTVQEEGSNAQSEAPEPVIASSLPTNLTDVPSGSRSSLTSNAPAETSANNAPLPTGWEQRFDQNGRIYYIDHISKTTTWNRPAVNTQSEPATNNSQTQEASSNRRQARSGPETAANDSNSQRRHIGDESNPSAESTDESDEASGSTTASASAVAATATATNSSSRPASNTTNNKNVLNPPLPPGWDFSYSDKGRMFFIDHANKTTSWIDPRTSKPSVIPNLDFENRIGALPSGWEERRHHDGRIFYIDHIRRQTQWEDPRLQKFAGPAVPYSRDYKQKFDSYRKLLPAAPPKGSQFGGIDKYLIRVKRTNVLEDSYNKIMHEKNPELLRMPIWIEFEGEKSYDYGGVSREWFHVLSKEIFNPYYGLFEYSAIDNYTLQINPNSGLVNEHHLDYYHFIGRVVGMAAYHNRLIDGFFIRPFYKWMLNKPINLNDIEAVDIEYYKSMKYIMDTDDVECLEMTFTSEEDVYGQQVEHELKPNGKNIKVTNENKKEFIDLVIQWRFVDRMKKQMLSFMKGFNEIIPQRCIQMFDPKEFELLLSGLGDVNIKDWQINTIIKGEYNMQHRVIQWFWMAMYSFPNELRLRFLQFVTGTSRVPMNGFAELQGSNGYQKFTIQSWGDYKSLPRAHTCFNRLDLPPYRSYEELREKLLLAVENSEGFDGVD